MRTPKAGRSGASRDLTLIVRALARAEADESRSDARRDELCAHLRGAIRILSEEPSARRAPARQKREPAVGPPAEV